MKTSPTTSASPTKITLEPGFFGERIAANQGVVCENPTEDMAIQLSGAALAGNAKAGRTTLYVITERRDVKIALCTLDQATSAHFALSHAFSPMDGAVTFSTEGPNDIHLSGYVEADMDEEPDDDEMGTLYSDDDDDDEEGFLEVEDELDEDDEVEDSGRFEVIEEKKSPVKKEEKKETPKKEQKKETPKKEEKGKKRAAEESADAEAPKKAKNIQMRKGGVSIEETTIGKGKEATKGKKVQILYKGTLAKNGKQFDSNQNRKSPFSFRLGSGDVIKGMDIGVEGMRVGGKRTINIPSKMGYGSEGAGRDIPPNSNLVFEIELLNA